MFKIGDKFVNPNAPFVHDGISYPGNWLKLSTPEERAALGIIEVPDPVDIDRRFFIEIDTGNIMPGFNGPKPRDLKTVQIEQIAEVDRSMANLLKGTDWTWIRFMETGDPIPEDIAAYRKAVREEGKRLKEAINNAKEVEDVKEIATKPRWPMNRG